ncbi:MAG: LPS assembly lipoprotein LptE [Myxococcota bacterium]
MCACGYQPLHTGELFGARRIAVLPPRESQPVGIAGFLVDDLRRRLAAHGMVLTNDIGSADAVLSGEVTAASTGPLAAVPGTPVRSFATGVSYEAVLADKDGTPLWSGRFRGSDSFVSDDTQTDVAGETLATEGNRRVALARVAESLARQVEDSLLRANPSEAPKPAAEKVSAPARSLELPGSGLPPREEER